MQRFYLEFSQKLSDIMQDELNKNVLQLDFYMDRTKDPKHVQGSANSFYSDFKKQKSFEMGYEKQLCRGRSLSDEKPKFNYRKMT